MEENRNDELQNATPEVVEQTPTAEPQTEAAVEAKPAAEPASTITYTFGG